MTNYLTPKQAAHYLNIGRSTLAKMRTLGMGPRHLQIGRSVRYVVTDLNDWMGSQTRDARFSPAIPDDVAAPGHDDESGIK